MKDDTPSIGRLFSLSRDPVLCARDGRVTNMNPAAMALFGGDMAGRPISELLPEALLSAGNDPFVAAAVIAGQHATVSCTVFEDLRLYSIIIPDQAAEKPTELPFSVSMREITNTIKITAEQITSLSERYEDLKMERYAAIMRHSASKLKRLVNAYTLLNACIEGTQPFHPLTTNVSKLCARMVQTVSDLSESYGIELVFTGEEEDVPADVDPDLIYIMLLNLLSNSLMHTDPGGRVEVDLRATASQLIITVSDNGSGIPPEKMSAVFSQYQQPVRLSNGQATAGMGLAVAEQIARLHGGTIVIQSVPGKGSTIAARLVRKQSASLKAHWTPYDNDIIERVMTELSTWLTWKDYRTEFSD